MLFSKISIGVKKALSLFVAILFTFNSILFAQPLSKETLRGASTAVSVQTDIARSLQTVPEPILDYKILPPDIQKLQKKLVLLDVKLNEAYRAAINSQHDPYFWDAVHRAKERRNKVTRKLLFALTSFAEFSLAGDADSVQARIKELEAYRAAINSQYDPYFWDDVRRARKICNKVTRKFLFALTSSAKSSSAGDANSAQAHINELEKDIDYYENLIKIVHFESTPATEAPNDYQGLWDAYYKALAVHSKAVRELLAAKKTFSDKSSSSGINVEVNKMPEIFAYLNIEEQDAMFSMLEIGLKSQYAYNRFSTAMRLLFLGSVDKKILFRYKDDISFMIRDHMDDINKNGDMYDKLFLAIGLAILGNCCEEILSDYTDIIYPILKNNQSSFNPYYSILTVIGLSILGDIDQETLSDYKNNIISTLEDDLKNGGSDIKLLAAVASAAFISIDKDMLSDYRDTILFILKDGLKNFDQCDNFLAVIGLIALSEKDKFVYRIVVNYPGLKKAITISGKDTYELAENLNQSIGEILNISFKAISDERLELNSPSLSEKIIVNINKENEFEHALLHSIAPMIFIPAAAKSSSAGSTASRASISLNNTITEFTSIEPQRIGLVSLSKFSHEIQIVASVFKQFANRSPENAVAIKDSTAIAEDISWTLMESKDAAFTSEDFDEIMAGNFADIKPSATIIINQNDIPKEQLSLTRLLSKTNPYCQVLVERLGINIVLASEFNPQEDGAEHIVIISKTPIKVKGAESARYLNLQSEINDDEAFMQLPSAIVFAKGLILYSVTNSPDIESKLAFFYKILTSGKIPWSHQLLEEFLKPLGTFVLSLPKPRAVDKNSFDRLQRISLQAFIAA